MVKIDRNWKKYSSNFENVKQNKSKHRTFWTRCIDIDDQNRNKWSEQRTLCAACVKYVSVLLAYSKQFTVDFSYCIGVGPYSSQPIDSSPLYYYVLVWYGKRFSHLLFTVGRILIAFATLEYEGHSNAHYVPMYQCTLSVHMYVSVEFFKSLGLLILLNASKIFLSNYIIIPMFS